MPCASTRAPSERRARLQGVDALGCLGFVQPAAENDTAHVLAAACAVQRRRVRGLSWAGLTPSVVQRRLGAPDARRLAGKTLILLSRCVRLSHARALRSAATTQERHCAERRTSARERRLAGCEHSRSSTVVTRSVQRSSRPTTWAGAASNISCCLGMNCRSSCTRVPIRSLAEAENPSCERRLTTLVVAEIFCELAPHVQWLVDASSSRSATSGPAEEARSRSPSLLGT